MKTIFRGHFANSTLDFTSLWDNCLFVLDANILLNLYRYSDHTRTAFLNVLNEYKDRVWVPHRAAEEYLANRLEVIEQQQRKYDAAVSDVNKLLRELENSRQHPFVSEEVMAVCKNAFDALIAELSENKVIHTTRLTSDEIKEDISDLLDGKVGVPYSRSEVEAIILLGEERYKQKTPPGFADFKAKSGNSDIFSEKCRPFGDLIVWQQILDMAKKMDAPVVLVTDDGKEDWWLRHQGKTIGPRPELIREFYDFSGQDFYMYHPDKFLETANGNLSLTVSEDALMEIRGVREDHASGNHKTWSDWESGVFEDIQAANSEEIRLQIMHALDHKAHLLQELEQSKEDLDYFASVRGLYDDSVEHAESEEEVRVRYYELMAAMGAVEAEIYSLESQLNRVKSKSANYFRSPRIIRRKKPDPK